jgi:hypothetical protein
MLLSTAAVVVRSLQYIQSNIVERYTANIVGIGVIRTMVLGLPVVLIHSMSASATD